MVQMSDHEIRFGAAHDSAFSANVASAYILSTPPNAVKAIEHLQVGLAVHACAAFQPYR